MKLSTSTTAAILAVVASVKGAAAVDFDFREFEASFIDSRYTLCVVLMLISSKLTSDSFFPRSTYMP